MDLTVATKLAERIAGTLSEFCARIEIAGSIRRRRPVVNDIDLVLQIKPGVSIHALRGRCAENCTPVRGCDDPRENMIWKLSNGVQLDLFMTRARTRDLLEARPGNWGSVFLCRTGSKEHNIYLVEHARRLGLRWNPYSGVFGPLGWPACKGMDTENARTVCLASEEEADIFKCLELDFIPPEQRERT